MSMNRRDFLRVALIGGGATVIVPQAEILDKCTKYFFAPKNGWSVPEVVPDLDAYVFDFTTDTGWQTMTFPAAMWGRLINEKELDLPQSILYKDTNTGSEINLEVSKL